MKSPAPASKYFLYARKSTDDEERQLLSIPAQIDELRTFAEKEGLVIADTFIESKTAKVPGRELFNQMLDRVEKGEAQGILAWHPDRLARNAVDAGRIVYLLDRNMLSDLKFLTFWFQNTPQGLFMLSIAFGQSKYYVDSLSENTKRGLRQKVRNGECPGLAPMGYLNDRLNKKIIIDPKVAPTVSKLFQLFATDKFTYSQMSLFLKDHEILTSGNKLITRDRVKFFLSNPFYFGYFRFKGEIYQGIHEPLITKKLFDEVQAVIKRRTHVIPQKSLDFPFTGLIRCGECGMMITAEQHLKYYKTLGYGQTFLYYRCTRKSKIASCSQPFIRQEILTAQLNQHIQKVSLSTSDHDWLIKRLESDEHQQRSEVLVIVQEFKKDLLNINEKLHKLLDSYLDNVVSREDYLNRKDKFMSEKKTIEQRIETLEQSPNKWLEPMREFFDTAVEADKIASDNINL
ncbi:MAG: recombinase family protein, partial [Microgenomates group bacterium]